MSLFYQDFFFMDLMHWYIWGYSLLQGLLSACNSSNWWLLLMQTASRLYNDNAVQLLLERNF